MSNHELITALDDDGTSHPIEKLTAHLTSIRHLAISIFVFRGDELLIQQRADGKYHSGGLWANSCCSHPRWGESPADCARRRLDEELGFQTDLTEFGIIDYAAPVGDLFENEQAHCFVGEMPLGPDDIDWNPEEVQAVRWMTREEILADQAENPGIYTPWFKIYMARHADLLAPHFTARQ